MRRASPPTGPATQPIGMIDRGLRVRAAGANGPSAPMPTPLSAVAPWLVASTVGERDEQPLTAPV